MKSFVDYLEEVKVTNEETETGEVDIKEVLNDLKDLHSKLKNFKENEVEFGTSVLATKAKEIHDRLQLWIKENIS